MNIFFDLDGTLIDAKQRVYQLFQYLVSESSLSFESYWEIKKRQVSNSDILKNEFLYDDLQVSTFHNKWMDLIEQVYWLKLDTVFDGVIDLLQKLHSAHSIYVVTARQNRDSTIKQIENLGIIKYLKDVFVTEGKIEKHQLIKQFLSISPDDWIVGDTGKDIEAGKKLGVNTAAVLSGFRNKEVLLKYKPDIILENVNFLTSKWNN